METKQDYILPPNPKPIRGYSCPFELTSDGKWIGYGVRSNVVMRSIEDLKVSKIFEKHYGDITGLAFSPKGELAISADNKGDVIIWNVNTLKEVKKFEKLSVMKITNLQFFDNDSKFLFCGGEEKKTLANCVEISSGKKIANFEHITLPILAGSCRQTAPFKCALGGESGKLTFYKEIPFVYETSSEEHKNKYITCIKYSPDDSKFISVGTDKRIIMYDGETGKVKDIIANDKTPNNHTLSIISFRWLDNDRIITCSSDKTVKIWDINEKKCTLTLHAAEKPGVTEMMNNVVSDGKIVLAITLNGLINVWNLEGATDGKLPDYKVDGHQGAISYIAYAKTTNEIFSSDSEGKIFLWKENSFPQLILSKEKPINSMKFSNDESFLYICFNNGTFICLERESLKEKYVIEKKDSLPKCIVPSRKTNDTLFVLCNNSFIQIANGAIVKESKLKFEGTAMEVNEELGEILIGDRKGKLHILDMNLTEKKSQDLHIREVTVIKLSPDGKLVASGDSQREISVWDAATKETYTNRFAYHNAKIFGLDWSEDSKYLLSCSLDDSVYIWNVEKKTKLKQFTNPREFNNILFVQGHSVFAGCDNYGIIKLIHFQE